MRVLVDTSVWSHALRRKKSNLSGVQKEIVRELEGLIETHQSLIIGPIRQELLSGVKEQASFDWLKGTLDLFQNEPIQDTDYVLAAEFFNQCQSVGIIGGDIDFLICAVSYRTQSPIFTTDKDFKRFSERLGLPLYHKSPI